MVLGDGGQVVDIEHLAAERAHGLETHVVDALGLEAGGEAAGGVAEVEHQGVAGAVDVAVDGVGVLPLAGIFGIDIPSAHMPFRTHFSGSYPSGQVIEVQRAVNGHDNGVERLVFGHVASSESKPHVPLLHSRDPLLQFQLHVSAQGGIPLIIPAESVIFITTPITPLFTSDGGERNTPEGLYSDLRATQSAVDT